VFRLTLNGKPIDENSMEGALLELVTAHMREQIGSIRHPVTGEFPTVAAMGDLSNLTFHIEGSPELLALVNAALGKDGGEADESSGQPLDQAVAPKAFLSYASEDAQLARKIAEALMQGGVDTWWDAWSIASGDSIRQRIDEGIGDCTHFIVLLTPRSASKPWVNIEIDAGLVRKLGGSTRFIPLRCGLDVGGLTPLLQTMHSPEVDAETVDVAQLIRDIHGMTRKPIIGEAPAAIVKANAIDSAHSPAAMTVAKYFVEAAERGCTFDVQREPDELARELGLSSDDLSDAIYELKGMVVNHGGYLVHPHETLFANFDKHWMPWDPAQDALRLAASMVNDDGFPNEPPQMAERLGWSARQFNPALAYLVARDLVKDIRGAFTNDGFIAIIVNKTDATRRFVKGRT
jgi:hypothetical protein